MKKDIKTFMGPMHEACSQANAFAGGDVFDKAFQLEMLRLGEADGLTHLCISIAKVSQEQVVLDYMLISPALHGLQLSGMTHRVKARTQARVRRELKALKGK